MTDRHKAFFLSVALGCFEAVRNEERPGSTRYRKLDNAMDNCIKAVDLFNPDGFSFEDSKKAGDLIDEFNERIKQMYPEETRDAIPEG